METLKNIKLIRFGMVSLGAWLITFLLCLKYGSVPLDDLDLLMQVRLPRVILAAALGVGLAVTGAALQALFNNPLCEPYTLGIASGSAWGAVMGLSILLPLGISGMNLSALVGAWIFCGILELSGRYLNQTAPLLLVGVMLGFFGNSVVGIWLSLTDSQGWTGALSWLYGDLSRARLQSSIVTAISVFSLSLLLWKEWRSMDALMLGEEKAQAMGIDVPRARRKIILLSSLIVSLCVSAGGMIGFVGLVIPHWVRRWMGSLHFSLIPYCMIWGGILLMLSDCVSRVVASPYELPVGIVTSLIGAPLFILLLVRRNRELHE